MARIRTIKPEFFTSEQLADCSPTARLLFAGLIVFSDDHGVHPASSKRLKMEVFPGDKFSDDEIRGMVQELVKAKLVREFEADNQRFWHVITFETHQRVDKPTYKYPVPPAANIDDHSTTAPGDVDDHSTTVRPRNGMESNGMEENTPLTPQGGDGSLKTKSKKRSKQPPFDHLAATIPPSLDTPAFREAWQGWGNHRREIGHPLKPTMADAQLAKMANMGPARAVAAIEHTISMGWQGLREPEPHQVNGQTVPAVAPEKPKGKPLMGEAFEFYAKHGRLPE